MNYKIDKEKTYNIINTLLELIKDGNNFASVERRTMFDNENIVFQMKKDDEDYTVLQVLNRGLILRLRADNFSVEQIANIACNSINL